MADFMEEKESFDKLIRVLEDALEGAAKILGPNARPALRSRYRALEHATQVYEDHSDLLDAARAGRSRLLEHSD
jgi:hypothetical protein